MQKQSLFMMNKMIYQSLLGDFCLFDSRLTAFYAGLEAVLTLGAIKTLYTLATNNKRAITELPIMILWSHSLRIMPNTEINRPEFVTTTANFRCAGLKV